jgi:hypothetical protein
MLELTVDQSALVKVAKLMKAESNGIKLKADLIVAIKAAVAPGVTAVQGKLRAIPHSSVTSTQPALGAYLAARVRPSVRMAGGSAGIRVRLQQTPNIRGFKMAGRRLNRTHWRHKVYGQDIWVEQISPIPGYFDDTLMAGKDQYLAAVLSACRRMAMRLGERL